MGLNTGTSTHLHTQDIPDKVNKIIVSTDAQRIQRVLDIHISQLTAQ